MGFGGAIGGAIGAVGSIASGIIGMKGAEMASDAYGDAAAAAAKVQKDIHKDIKERLDPYEQVGAYAIDELFGYSKEYRDLKEDTADVTKRLEESRKKLAKVIRKKKGAEEIDLRKRQVRRLERMEREQLAEMEAIKEPGLLDKYPELEPYPDMPEYPTLPGVPEAPDLPGYPELPPPPTAGPYPDMPEKPIIAYGGDAAPENALIDMRPEAYTASPAYEFQVDEAMKAVERMASARGYRLSPRAAEEFMTQAEGLAKEDYYNWLNAQMQKSEMALRDWAAGRQAAIEDWQLPHEMAVQDWERARQANLDDWLGVRAEKLGDWELALKEYGLETERGIGDWARQREALAQDWAGRTGAQTGDWLNRYNVLMDLLRGGQQAASQQGAFGQNLSNQLSQTMLGAGQMQADKYINQANALSQALTGGIENALMGYYGSQQQAQPQKIQGQPSTWLGGLATNLP